VEVEPVLPSRGPGRIILLNGASSSGNSTIAKALRDALDEPWRFCRLGA
jgi:chloramphenicol 3-O phosphotransferase